ncbi:hypothetical protein [Clostridium sp.]|uniref:hypothetical protein n=1 Tax=Clostridium sp. TaxID=1506 RepID=UPI00304FF720
MEKKYIGSYIDMDALPETPKYILDSMNYAYNNDTFGISDLLDDLDETPEVSLEEVLKHWGIITPENLNNNDTDEMVLPSPPNKPVVEDLSKSEVITEEMLELEVYDIAAFADSYLLDIYDGG